MLGAPLTFEPVLVPKPWGGDRLGRFGRAVEPGARIGESWDLADLTVAQTTVPDPVSRVRDGAAAGSSLGELVRTAADALLGDATPTAAGRFPLLVKLLDAREWLSVQVHPPRSLAPDSYKTESWLVVDTAPGAELLLGVREGVALDDVLAAMGTEALLELLARVPVEVGDVVHLPAGTIHALGAGVLVAEVQTTSDTTYRMWDWPAERGGGRQLHVEQAREAVREGWAHNTGVLVRRATDGVLVDAEPYLLEHETLLAGEVLDASARGGLPRVVVVTTGALSWPADDGDRSLPRGGLCLLPAACTLPLRAGADGATVVVATPR